MPQSGVDKLNQAIAAQRDVTKLISAAQAEIVAADGNRQDVREVSQKLHDSMNLENNLAAVVKAIETRAAPPRQPGK